MGGGGGGLGGADHHACTPLLASNLPAYRALPSASSLQDPISAPMARTRTQTCAAGGRLSITQSTFFVAKPSAGNQSEDGALADSGSSLYCARNAAAPCGRD